MDVSDNSKLIIKIISCEKIVIYRIYFNEYDSIASFLTRSNIDHSKPQINKIIRDMLYYKTHY